MGKRSFEMATMKPSKDQRRSYHVISLTFIVFSQVNRFYEKLKRGHMQADCGQKSPQELHSYKS